MFKIFGGIVGIACSVALCALMYNGLYYGAKYNRDRQNTAFDYDSDNIVYRQGSYPSGPIIVRKFETEDGIFYLTTSGHNAVSLVKIK